MSQKTIQLNPAFLKTTGAKKAKTRSKRDKIKNTKMPGNTNAMRKQLLKKIKDYQKNISDDTKTSQKTTKEKIENDSGEKFANEFNKSLDFLQNLSSKKKATKRKKPKHKPSSAPSIPDSGKNHTPSTEIQIATELPLEMMESSNMIVPARNTTLKNYSKEPEYGCLKNGKKPVYREWKRKTQRNLGFKKAPTVAIDSTSMTTLTNNSENIILETQDKMSGTTLTETTSDRENLLLKAKNDFKKIKEAPPDVTNSSSAHTATATQDIEHRIKTKKMHLGKQSNTRRVSVLVKNRDTRKRIKHEHGSLKQKSILEVKNYLRKKNLLKSGSDAPPDVLRTMYENAILTGDIKNNTNETLMHNFYND